MLSPQQNKTLVLKIRYCDASVPVQEIKKQAENVQYADTGYTVCMFVLKSREGVSKSNDRFKYQYEEAKMKHYIKIINYSFPSILG